MFTIIFGRSSCPFCLRAKLLAEKLKHQYNNFNYHYIDIEEKEISKSDLAKKAGKPIKTIPQIFINNQHIGGYTDFKAYIEEHLSSL